MTTQEVFLALVPVSSSVLSPYPWPCTGQHTDTAISELETNGAHRNAGLVPSGKAASAKPWKDSHKASDTL